MDSPGPGYQLPVGIGRGRGRGRGRDRILKLTEIQKPSASAEDAVDGTVIGRTRLPLQVQTVTSVSSDRDWYNNLEATQVRNACGFHLRYSTIPSITLDDKKPAMITCISSDSDELSIVLLSEADTYVSIKSAINELKLKNQLQGPCPASVANVYVSMFEHFPDVNIFLAPVKNDWTELYRVEVERIMNKKFAKVRYMDIGKRCIIPIENLALHISRNKAVEPFLELTSPQAVTVKLEPNITDPSILALAQLDQFEGSPCIVKIKRLQENVPIADLKIFNRAKDGILDMAYMLSSNSLVPKQANDVELKMLREAEQKMKELNIMKKR